MPAPKGNEYWKLRSKHGRDKIFETPEILWDAACEYFQSVTDNPLSVQDNKGTKNINDVDLIMPFTIYGLCIFLDIDRVTYSEYRKHEDFSTIIRKVDDIIYNQKFSGAAVGIFNANIIARDLGLKEQSEVSGSVSINPKKFIGDNPE